MSAEAGGNGRDDRFARMLVPSARRRRIRDLLDGAGHDKLLTCSKLSRREGFPFDYEARLGSEGVCERDVAQLVG